MKTIGIICEYNPFHNGHLFHINKIREKYPNDILICVLSGYFTQRGEISILNKSEKIEAALNYGVDIVVSLPTLYATQSADIFAEKSIEILQALQTDILIFGSESNNPEELKKIAKKELELGFEEKVRQQIKKGVNYPTALKNALQIQKEFNRPNDLLGIAYTKAILKNNYHINIETIKRTNDYRDTQNESSIISANQLREKLRKKEEVSAYTPLTTPLRLPQEETYFHLLKYKVLTDPHLENYLDVTEGLENLLKKEINNANHLEDLLAKISSKRYTKNRLRRMCCHIFLGITKEDAQQKLTYLQILGINEKGKKYLKQNRKDITLSLKLEKETKIFEIERRATLLYDMINNTNMYQTEQLNKPIIIETRKENEK